MLKPLVFLLIIIVVGLVCLWFFIAQPIGGSASSSGLTIDPQRLRSHVETMVRDFSPRSYAHPDNLNGAAHYIEKHFVAAGGEVSVQEFTVSGQVYRNVIARFGNNKTEKFIVGAHYDACGKTPGADDNGSGIAALIELAYLFGGRGQQGAIELVAYSLEEPPHFGTDSMGSYVHASRLRGEASQVAGVVVLETIGYFSEKWGSQSYPLPLLHLFYPSQGNFIAVVGRLDHRRFTAKVKAGMKGSTDLPVYSINAPATIAGIDFSDHRSYWTFGLQAVMVTDTAFYRNKAYHGPGDTPERLNYNSMAQVVVMVYEMVVNWRNE